MKFAHVVEQHNKCNCPECRSWILRWRWALVTTEHYWPRQGGEWDNDDPWELVPAWHPAKWILGYDIRARCHDVNFHIGDDHWCYGYSQQVARRLLEERYAPKEDACTTCGGDCGQCGGTKN